MKIISYDLETTPNLAWIWGKYQQDAIAFQSQWQLLSFSVKPLGGKAVSYGQDKYSEKELVKLLHKELDEADVVIAHNGKKFDNKKANAKFVEFGLGPPSPFQTIDTKYEAKKHFGFVSNKLDDLGEKLGCGRKVKHPGFEMWLGCMNGDKKSWYLMLKYNRQDVVLLEKIYYKLRPWMTHPYQGGLCNNCGGNQLQKRGISKTKNRNFQRLQCQECGAWSQTKI